MGDTLYKWVDAQGNVHYSDKPHPGATKVHLPHSQTYAAPVIANQSSSTANTDGQAQHQAYSSFQITSPAPDETLWNVQSVTVSVSLQPGLQQGDTITITVDGQSQGPGGSLTATFDGLDRGQHSASAILNEANGQTMSATAVTFYIQKATQKAH